MEKEIIQGFKTALEQKGKVALVTVINTIGSTPRKVGARMLVFPDGTMVGTIGGGCGEADARREALNVLASEKGARFSLNLTLDVAEEEGMVCGGRMDFYIDYFNFLDAKDHEFMSRYLSQLENYKEPVLITVVDSVEPDLVGNKLYIDKEGNMEGTLGSELLEQWLKNNPKIKTTKSVPVLAQLDSQGQPVGNTKEKAAYQLFVTPPDSELVLIILGGGHIGLALATMAKIIGYKVIVIDDRPSFANPVRFHMADQVICNDFEQALQEIKISPASYVVIVTRGHRHDKVCLKGVIQKPAAYIGMIGSRRRVKALLASLEEEGIPSEALQKLYSPIGLKIGAETPEELAVCILGEIIKVNKGVE